MVHVQSELCHNSQSCCAQGELAIKNADLAVAARSVEEMLKEISQSTAAAEKEKNKVAVIVDNVSKTASVGFAVYVLAWVCKTPCFAAGQ